MFVVNPLKWAKISFHVFEMGMLVKNGRFFSSTELNNPLNLIYAETGMTISFDIVGFSDAMKVSDGNV
jgi:hypothetical protein